MLIAILQLDMSPDLAFNVRTISGHVVLYISVSLSFRLPVSLSVSQSAYLQLLVY